MRPPKGMANPPQVDHPGGLPGTQEGFPGPRRSPAASSTGPIFRTIKYKLPTSAYLISYANGAHIASIQGLAALPRPLTLLALGGACCRPRLKRFGGPPNTPDGLIFFFNLLSQLF